MRVIAIIGPFTASTTAGIMANVQQARDLADEVWRLGAVAYCPHVATCHLYQKLPEALFYAGHLEMVGRCDAGLLVPGWRQSRGSWREKAEMTMLGKPVFEDLDTLKGWLAEMGVTSQAALTVEN